MLVIKITLLYSFPPFLFPPKKEGRRINSHAFLLDLFYLPCCEFCLTCLGFILGIIFRPILGIIFRTILGIVVRTILGIGFRTILSIVLRIIIGITLYKFILFVRIALDDFSFKYHFNLFRIIIFENLNPMS